jgi:hypothetical protein
MQEALLAYRLEILGYVALGALLRRIAHFLAGH